MSCRHLKYAALMDWVEPLSGPLLRSRVTNERHHSADLVVYLMSDQAKGVYTYSSEWTGFDPGSIQYIEYIFSHYPTWFHFNLRFGGLG